ncbi:substrate-binding domain-containing protein [Dictyobacter kobayashii]|uniref:substrate-binding domain-containing protein n=1 Tax=Dictyobacter kobayashii TaxID=2014872 RepID=UPI001C3FC78E|nr:substrate-binding domain-containing protein [Dictyobacter kobayashii]
MELKRALREDTKTEELSKKLRQLAYEKGPGAKLPTVRSLCDMLGTTRVTVGEVLDLLEAENILYRKDRQGIFVSPKIHSKHLCILFDSSNLNGPTISPFWSLLWVRLEQEAQHRAALRDETYAIHVVSSLQNAQSSVEDSILKLIQRGEAHGILAIGLNTLARPWIEQLPVPYVTFAGPGRWIVQLDGSDVGQKAAHVLVKQGCKQIGFWTYNTPLESSNEFNGFRQALAEHNATFYPELVQQPHLISPAVPSLQEQGYLLALNAYGPLNRMKPDGIFIADDMMTDGALIAFEELGVKVGSDVHIVTHGNVGSPVLYGRARNMTIFDYDANDIVHAMYYLLDTLLIGQEPSEEVIWIKSSQRLSR